MAGLTPKQQRFCQEYVIDLNGTQAAIRAGYSPSRARQTGSRMVTNGDIQDEIERLQSAIAERLDITAERVIRGIARIAFADLRKLYDTRGRLKPITELDNDTAGALAGIEIDRDDKGIETRKVKIGDRLKALEMLVKHLGLNLSGETEAHAKLVFYWPHNGRDDPAIIEGRVVS